MVPLPLLKVLYFGEQQQYLIENSFKCISWRYVSYESVRKWKRLWSCCQCEQSCVRNQLIFRLLSLTAELHHAYLNVDITHYPESAHYSVNFKRSIPKTKTWLCVSIQTHKHSMIIDIINMHISDLNQHAEKLSMLHKKSSNNWSPIQKKSDSNQELYPNCVCVTRDTTGIV